MPKTLRTLLRNLNAFLGQLFFSGICWIILISCFILAPRTGSLQALPLAFGVLSPVLFLSILGIFPIVGQIVYRVITPSVLAFLTGGEKNPVLQVTWQIPHGFERIGEPYFSLPVAHGTLLSFVIEAGFWLSVLCSGMVVFQSATRFLHRHWPSHAKADQPPAKNPATTGFFERCQSANLWIFFLLVAATLLGSCVFATPGRPLWEGALFSGVTVLATLVVSLAFSLIRIPPGSGWVLYALLMPELLREIIAGIADFHPAVLSPSFVGIPDSTFAAVTLVEYALLTGWLWMVFLFLHRSLGLFQTLFPNAWPKTRPLPKAAGSPSVAKWKSRLITLGVTALCLIGVGAIAGWAALGEDLRFPVVYSFEWIKGTPVCIENCAKLGGQWAQLPDNPPPGEPRTLRARLPKTPGPLFLRVEPRGQEGLAFVDLSVAVQLIGPDGKVIAHVDAQDLFPGSEFAEYCFYKKDIAIPALEGGEYTLIVTPYNGGIAWIKVTIRKGP